MVYFFIGRREQGSLRVWGRLGARPTVGLGCLSCGGAREREHQDERWRERTRTHAFMIGDRWAEKRCDGGEPPGGHCGQLDWYGGRDLA